MPGVVGDPRQADDSVVYVDMLSTNNTATRGDYIAFSAKAARAVATGDTVALFPYSGLGIALSQNPIFDEFGSASANGKMPVGRRGIFRVSAVTGNYSAGLFCFPVQTGSGIVGQTGLTGQAALWSATGSLGGLVSATTARIVSASGASTNVVTGTAVSERYTIDPTSAVGQIVRVIAAGATGQWDIILLDPRGATQVPLVNR